MINVDIILHCNSVTTMATLDITYASLMATLLVTYAYAFTYYVALAA